MEVLTEVERFFDNLTKHLNREIGVRETSTTMSSSACSMAGVKCRFSFEDGRRLLRMQFPSGLEEWRVDSIFDEAMQQILLPVI